MNNEYDWDDLQDDDEGPIDPKSLPKQLRKVIRDAKKEAADSKAETALLREQVRQTNLSTVLTSRGVSAKVAKLIPADVTSAEAIDTWLTEYGDVFGAPAATTQPANQTVASSNGQQFLENADTTNRPSGEEIAAMQRMQGTTGTAMPFGGRMNELQLKLDDPSLTEEQLDLMISSGGL